MRTWAPRTRAPAIRSLSLCSAVNVQAGQAALYQAKSQCVRVEGLGSRADLGTTQSTGLGAGIAGRDTAAAAADAEDTAADARGLTPTEFGAEDEQQAEAEAEEEAEEEEAKEEDEEEDDEEDDEEAEEDKESAEEAGPDH